MPISVLVPLMPVQGQPMEIVETQDEMLIPRLVSRIAELEHKLHEAAPNEPLPDDHGLMGRLTQLLKTAQSSIDQWISYILGAHDVNKQLTEEATAKALLITIRKVNAIKEEAVSLKQHLATAKQEATEVEAAHREHFAALQAELESNIASIHALNGTVSCLQAKNESLTTELQRSEALAGALRSSLVKQDATITTLKSQVESLTEQLSVAQQEIEEERRKSSTAETTSRLITGELDGLKSTRSVTMQELHSTQSKLEKAQALSEDFQRRFLAERAERRRLHEELQTLRGNIRVVCRIRGGGALGRKNSSQESLAVSVPMEGTVRVSSGERKVQEYELSAVFQSTATQADVFDEIWPVCRSCADGYNVCIFAYGQTGAGKTHTMMGTGSDPGISLRALRALFDIRSHEARDGNTGTAPRKIEVSLCEIYLESVRDLLWQVPQKESMSSVSRDKVKALEVSGVGPFTSEQLLSGAERIPGVTWITVDSPEAAMALLEQGSTNRVTAATALNASSSRSHAILSIRLSDPEARFPPSSLHLVDLAGSERVERSEAAGQQLKEAQAINKSLSALGDVITALQARSSHIPYRNSKLTQVLQDSLCGSSKVVLVSCIAPEVSSAGETVSTLTFAERAGQVENGPAISMRKEGSLPNKGLKENAVATAGKKVVTAAGNSFGNIAVRTNNVLKSAN